MKPLPAIAAAHTCRAWGRLADCPTGYRVVMTSTTATAPNSLTGTDPSRRSRRTLVSALALLGCVVSIYLALYQYHVIGAVWDPFFGDGSSKVLTSPLSRALPVSDATLGALAYAFEALVESAGRDDRWYTQPWLVMLVGLTSAGLAVTSLGLIISQPVLTGTFCTLCLTSAAVSFVIAALVYEEVRAVLDSYLRHN
jgi:uncharacterized membrane protein